MKDNQIEMKSFDEFYNRRLDVEYAYNKLRGVEGKPVFDDVYSYLSKFIKPFAQKDKKAGKWIYDKEEWRKKKEDVNDS